VVNHERAHRITAVRIVKVFGLNFEYFFLRNSDMGLIYIDIAHRKLGVDATWYTQHCELHSGVS